MRPAGSRELERFGRAGDAVVIKAQLATEETKGCGVRAGDDGERKFMISSQWQRRQRQWCTFLSLDTLWGRVWALAFLGTRTKGKDRLWLVLKADQRLLVKHMRRGQIIGCHGR
jgi:hypothetical protein